MKRISELLNCDAFSVLIPKLRYSQNHLNVRSPNHCSTGKTWFLEFTKIFLQVKHSPPTWQCCSPLPNCPNGSSHLKQDNAHHQSCSIADQPQHSLHPQMQHSTQDPKHLESENKWHPWWSCFH